MSFLSRLFGRDKEAKGQVTTQAKPLEEQVLEMLNSVRLDGASLYVEDRDRAFHWYRQQPFSQHDYTKELFANVYADMSARAAENAIWQEAWAGFHRALAGYLHLNLPDKIPLMLWRLGQAHTGLAHYELAHLFLETAQRLAEQQKDTQFILTVRVDQAVLAKLSQPSAVFDEAMNHLFTILFPEGKPSDAASKVASGVCKYGNTNQEWRHDERPIKSCLIHAIGYYGVCLELFRQLNDQRSIGITLFNMGETWSMLGEITKARACWEESLPHLEGFGDSEDSVVSEVIHQVKMMLGK